MATPMTLSRETKYPNRRTYVLKVRADATASALSGRLENLVTGHQVDFESALELVASVIRDVESSMREKSQAE